MSGGRRRKRKTWRKKNPSKEKRKYLREKGWIVHARRERNPYPDVSKKGKKTKKEEDSIEESLYLRRDRN